MFEWGALDRTATVSLGSSYLLTGAYYILFTSLLSYFLVYFQWFSSKNIDFSSSVLQYARNGNFNRSSVL